MAISPIAANHQYNPAPIHIPAPIALMQDSIAATVRLKEILLYILAVTIQIDRHITPLIAANRGASNTLPIISGYDSWVLILNMSIRAISSMYAAPPKSHERKHLIPIRSLQTIQAIELVMANVSTIRRMANGLRPIHKTTLRLSNTVVMIS